MRSRRGWPCAADAVAPLLFGFKPFERRNREVEQGNAALQAGKAEDALAHYDKAVAKLPGESGVHLDRGAALYALSRSRRRARSSCARREGRTGAEGDGVSQPGERAVQAGEAQGRRRGVQARAGAAARRQGRQVEPRDRAAEAEGRGKEEAGRQGQGQEQGRQERRQGQAGQEGRQGQEQGRQEDDKDKDKRTRRQARRRKTRKTRTRRRSSRSPRKRKQNQPERIQEMLKNLEANPKDLEKERARLRAVRRARRRGTGDGGIGEKASRRRSRWRSSRRLVGGRGPAGAGASSFSASMDRAAVAPNQPFLYRVTLTTSDGQPEGFKPPDFRGLRVVGGPFTQTGMSMAGRERRHPGRGQRHLELPADGPPGAQGQVAIGAAHVRVGGQELSSNAVQVRIGAPAAAPPAQRQQRGPTCFRAACSATRAGGARSQCVVGGRGVPPRRRRQEDGVRGRAGDGDLVPVRRPMPQSNFSRYAAQVGRLLDGGDPSTNPRGRLAFADQVEGGQHYQAAVVLQRALFPLAPGKLDRHADGGGDRRTPISSGAPIARAG